MGKNNRACLLKLLPNRTKLNYQGYPLDQLEGQDAPLLSKIQEEPDFYLGPECSAEGGLGFLLHLFEPPMRLHVQSHPSASFAKKRLASPQGALKCYYILEVAPQTAPFIRLGFQRLPGKYEWKRIIEKQDIPAMDACFEPIPVAPGELWSIPGGMPHALGEHIRVLEIREPADWAVYCEFDREGMLIPPEARFLGKGLDFCLDSFQYEEKTVETVIKDHRVNPILMEFGGHFHLEQLAGHETGAGFRVQRLVLEGNVENLSLPGGIPQVALVTKGSVQVSVGDEALGLKTGESLFIAGGVHYLDVQALLPGEIFFISPT